MEVEKGGMDGESVENSDKRIHIEKTIGNGSGDDH